MTLNYFEGRFICLKPTWIQCRGNESFGCYYVWLSVFTGLKV